MPNNFILTAEQISSLEDRVQTLEDRANNKTSAIFKVNNLDPVSMTIVPGGDNSLKIWAGKITLSGINGKPTFTHKGSITMSNINFTQFSLSATCSLVNDEPIVPILKITGANSFSIRLFSATGKKITSTAAVVNVIAMGY